MYTERRLGTRGTAEAIADLANSQKARLSGSIRTQVRRQPLRSPCETTLLARRFVCGGEGGIRTHDPLTGTPVFKTGAFNRSATSPQGAQFPHGPPRCPASAPSVPRTESSGISTKYQLNGTLSYVSTYASWYTQRMTALSLRVPAELERRLDLEARRAGVPRSAIARTAIEELLDRRERERYLAAFVAEARATYGDSKIREESLALADEALPLDNEALEVTETRRARRPTRGREKRKVSA